MIFIYGKRMLGKCDRIPGMCHVATQFYHIDYLPLIPVQSWVVISSNGNQFRGFKIPLSGKSVLLAWARTLTFFAAVATVIWALVLLVGGRSTIDEWIFPAILAAVSGSLFAFLGWHPICTKASFARACTLAHHMKLNEAGHAQIQQIYGQAVSRGFDVLPASQQYQPAQYENNG
jgi:hypothetical protein